VEINGIAERYRAGRHVHSPSYKRENPKYIRMFLNAGGQERENLKGKGTRVVRFVGFERLKCKK